jgi:hypothetical protein
VLGCKFASFFQNPLKENNLLQICSTRAPLSFLLADANLEGSACRLQLNLDLRENSPKRKSLPREEVRQAFEKN